MRFGVGDYTRDWELQSQVAVQAEELGYDCYLATDHYMGSSSNSSVDVWTLLSYIAANTSKIKLGTVVTPIPFRHPAILAKMVTSVDLVSKGRVIFGVGAGWYKPEFEAYSVWDEASIRVAKFREGLRLIMKLWTEDKVNFEGKFYKAIDAVLEPKPVQKPYPPIWFGTYGEYMQKIAAKYGDGWISNIGDKIRPSIEESRLIIEKLRRNRDRIQPGKKFTISISGGIEDGTERIEQLKELGCDYYILSGIQKHPGSLNNLKRFAQEILPSFN